MAEQQPYLRSRHQLIKPLKLPACDGEARRIVLDHHGNRCRRTFADAGEIVRFVKEQNLDRHFISPPRRPGRLPPRRAAGIKALVPAGHSVSGYAKNSLPKVSEVKEWSGTGARKRSTTDPGATSNPSAPCPYDRPS